MSTEPRLTKRPDDDGADRCLSANSQSIDWYSEGQIREVEVGGVQITVRFVGRKGRRARIAIIAPGGAVFRAAEQSSRTAANSTKSDIID